MKMLKAKQAAGGKGKIKIKAKKKQKKDEISNADQLVDKNFSW